MKYSLRAAEPARGRGELWPTASDAEASALCSPLRVSQEGREAWALFVFILPFGARAAAVPAASGPGQAPPLSHSARLAPEGSRGSGPCLSHGRSVAWLWPSSAASPHSQLTKYLLFLGGGLLSPRTSPSPSASPCSFPSSFWRCSQSPCVRHVRASFPSDRWFLEVGCVAWDPWLLARGYCGKPGVSLALP